MCGQHWTSVDRSSQFFVPLGHNYPDVITSVKAGGFMATINKYANPKDGKVYRVLAFGRISTEKQDEKSLEDQEQYILEYLHRVMPDAQFEITVIAGRGSGQYLDREEFLELRDKVSSGQYDIVIAEDLARILRRVQAFNFCEEAEDAATRVITINDNLDTKNENWEQTAFFAAYKHASFCSETSRRIRRSHRNRFKQGAIVLEMQYGYIKPHPKANDEEVHKDPAAIPIYAKWISMLEAGATYSEVARWLNANNVPVDPPKRKKRKDRCEKWTCAMVRRLTYNPLLKGERHRNKRMAIRVNKTGRPKLVEAPPEELLIRKVPHLAFVEPDRWDRLIRQLDKRNKKYSRSKESKNHPRSGIPKRRTRWPGQHLRCGVCGRFFVHGGHGKKARMMCNGAREYACWNALTVNATQVAEAVAGDIRELVRAIPSFDEDWAREYETQRTQLQVSKDAELGLVTDQLRKEDKELENLIGALASLGQSPSVLERIKSSESNIQLLKDRRQKLEQSSRQTVALPSMEEIIAVADESFKDLAVECEEFGRLMKLVVTEFYVLPYQLADGGRIQAKIAFKACLAPLLGHSDLDLLQFDRIVDLLKEPKRLRFLGPVVERVNAGEKHAAIAEELGIFKSEVGYAMVLHRRMEALGITDPWVAVTNASQAFDSYKRVRNPIFEFEPLEGYETTRHPKAA